MTEDAITESASDSRHRQLVASLRLIRSENVGPVTYRTLVRRFGSAEAALTALPDLAARGGSRRAIRISSVEAAEGEIATAERLGARFLCLGDVDFPAMLQQSEAPPPVLTVMGNVDVFAKPAVAIVGARNASMAGAKLTRMFAGELGDAGYAVVSGLARGIDTAAHEASLATGTIGVFAGGLDKPYPHENRPLMRRIVDGGGCLVTEMPFGWEPRAADFPRRNRVVVALALGVLVVEAAMRSGSLISARLANEMGRLVFAVPGSPLDLRAAGTNALLKDGAAIVTQTTDILQDLAPLDPRMTPRSGRSVKEAWDEASSSEPVTEERARVLQALGATPVSLDDLIVHVGTTPSAVQLVLLELDLAGRLERHPGGKISLVL